MYVLDPQFIQLLFLCFSFNQLLILVSRIEFPTKSIKDQQHITPKAESVRGNMLLNGWGKFYLKIIIIMIYQKIACEVGLDRSPNPSLLTSHWLGQLPSLAAAGPAYFAYSIGFIGS